MSPEQFEAQLKEILTQYRDSFTDKVYNEENEDHDILMDVYGITPLLKRENRQYWGRELGMCWQKLVCEVFRLNCDDYRPAMRVENNEPSDCGVGTDVIDTKYRIGSGDSGTLQKFRNSGMSFQEQGLRPVLLILRTDNLSSALSACKSGGWNIHIGDAAFDYIVSASGFDLKSWLQGLVVTKEFYVSR